MDVKFATNHQMVCNAKFGLSEYEFSMIFGHEFHLLL